MCAAALLATNPAASREDIRGALASTARGRHPRLLSSRRWRRAFRARSRGCRLGRCCPSRHAGFYAPCSPSSSRSAWLGRSLGRRTQEPWGMAYMPWRETVPRRIRRATPRRGTARSTRASIARRAGNRRCRCLTQGISVIIHPWVTAAARVPVASVTARTRRPYPRQPRRARSPSSRPF